MLPRHALPGRFLFRLASRPRRVCGAAAALALLAAAGCATTLAQQHRTGNVYGHVFDHDRAPLPGVEVTLTAGHFRHQRWVQVTNAWGEFRFLGLPPGAMKLKAELVGFSPIQPTKVRVNAGFNTNLEITMEGWVSDEVVSKVSSLEDPLELARGARGERR
jgi:hypothetical protein